MPSALPSLPTVLFLCEGDAESRDAWSGTALSVVRGLRDRGHVVRTADLELRGWRRLWVALRTFRPDREMWRSRFRFGSAGFRLRSRLAGRAVRLHRDRIDVVLQTGATFSAPQEAVGGLPLFLYCDGNMALAARRADSGHASASHLTDADVEAACRREARVYERAACVFTISERLERSFVDDFGLPAERVETVHAGPNLGADLVERVDRLRTERDDGPPTALFVGRRFERKGGADLLAAFRHVRSRLPEARLLVVGPADPVPSGEGVEWWGYLSKDDPDERRRLAEAYAGADVFCLPTRHEPFGIAFVEAMRFGLPCVGTRVDAVPEIVVDGRTGFLCEPGDVGALSDRLVELLIDPELAAAMGARGRNRAERRFTWERTVGRISDRITATVEAGDRARREG